MSPLIAACALAGTFEPTGAGPDVARFGFARWDVEDGLPVASVTDLDQRAEGDLVVGTFGGLVEFDGARFRVFDPATGLPSLRVTAIASSGDALWAGTQYGDVAVVGGGAERLSGAGVIWDLHARGEELWAATDGGIFRQGSGSWLAVGAREPVHALASVGDSLWVLGAGGVTAIYGSRVERVALPADMVPLAIAVEPGRVWVATTAGLVLLGAPGLVAPWTAQRAVLLIDAQHRMWASTDGILRLLGPTAALVDGVATAPTQWTIGARIASLFSDRDGNLWIGTDGDGLVRATARPFEHFARASGTAEASVQLLDTSGPEVVAAPSCGLPGVLRGGQFLPTDFGTGGCIGALYRDRSGAVWLGEDDTVVAPTGERLALPQRVLALTEDAAGVLWIGTEGAGVWTWDGALAKVAGIPDTVVSVIAVAADGAVWVAMDPGVAVVREGVVALRQVGLPAAQVRAITLDPDGTAWLGTYGGGLARVRGDAVTLFTTGEGLPENVVSIVLDDGRGSLWMNGNRGVFRVSRDDLEAVGAGSRARVRTTSFDTGEGNGGQHPVGGRDRQGRLWFATLRGAVAFDPAALAVPVAPPQARIEELAVKGRHVTASFTAPVLAPSPGARFEYRLLPAVPDWRDAGGSRRVDFPELGPGTYTLEVRAAVGDGAWSPAPARGTFTLEPRLTERWLFRGLVAALLLGAAGGTWGWRRRIERAHTEALREREAHYRQVFEAASDALLVLDGGRIAQANPAATAMFDLDPHGLEGSALLDSERSEGIRATGRFPARIATVPLGAHRLLTSVVDLGPQIALRERLEQADRLEAIGRLAGGVAHDFNNLLMVVEGNAAELAGLPELDAAAHETVLQIAKAAGRGAELTRQLLSFGQKQLLRPKVFDVAARVEHLRPVLQRLLPAEVALEVRAVSVWVLADPTQLEIALVNLVLNAVEAFPADGGRIAISAGPLTGEAAAARWAVEPRGDWARVTVTDDGSGISSEHLPRIFEPFFTTRTERGTGLGLAGVHGFVAQSYGHVFVRSELGKGTTFDLLLPGADAPPVASPTPGRAGVGRGRVLVCDDDELVLRTLQRLLEFGGYDVVSATSGEEALAVLARTAVDVLVTDVVMPGMNGVELGRLARAAHPGLRVVFVSGYTRDLIAEPLEGELLGKPFTRAALLAAVADARAAR